MAPPAAIGERLTRENNDAMVAGQIKYLSTEECYDLWSQVYDSDGNMLQALDTIQMQTLLPSALNAIKTASLPYGLKAVDLGCGTGRNTLALLDQDSISSIVGLELSSKMIAIAETSCQQKRSKQQALKQTSLVFEVYNMLDSPQPPASAVDADIVISTLVLEHIPLESFFPVISQILKSGGALLLTNMHARMGDISQAGFVDPKTGDKIRPTSYAHEIEDVIRVAAENGLVVEGQVIEASVDQTVVEQLGIRGKKWVGVTVWFGGIWRK